MDDFVVVSKNKTIHCIYLAIYYLHIGIAGITLRLVYS